MLCPDADALQPINRANRFKFHRPPPPVAYHAGRGIRGLWIVVLWVAVKAKCKVLAHPSVRPCAYQMAGAGAEAEAEVTPAAGCQIAAGFIKF